MKLKKKNQKGSVTANQIDESIKLVEKAVAIIDTGNPPMTTTDRNRRIKLRRGGEKYIPVLAQLATAYNVLPSTHSVDEMTMGHDVLTSLGPLHTKVSLLLKSIEDTMLRTQSETWKAATLFYSMLRPLADRDGNVAKALAPVENFFATRAKRGAAKGSHGRARQPATVAPPSAAVGSVATSGSVNGAAASNGVATPSPIVTPRA